MGPANACPGCGAARLANAPAGLCPRCLLGHGLRADPNGWSGEDGAGSGGSAGLGVTPAVGRRPTRPSGILSTLDETIGPVPRVLLRDGSVNGERPARACSEA